MRRTRPSFSPITVRLEHPGWKKALRPYGKTARAVCVKALEVVDKKYTHYELTIVLADDALVRQLNYDFRGQNKATNVLSFPSDPNPSLLRPRKGKIQSLGDIVLAYETIAREAEEQNKSFRAHATHMLVHGTLHLLGYDHMSEKEANIMESLEIKILKKLWVDNPYL